MENRPGVYRLYNMVTGKSYVGASKDVYKRWITHRYMLSRGYKDNIRIRQDLELHGFESFEFEVLEYCTEEELPIKEQKHFDEIKPEYNVWKHVKNGKGRTYTPEQLESFKRNHHGIKDPKKHSESLKKAWEKRKQTKEYQRFVEEARNRRQGTKASLETKEKMSASRKGKKMSADHCEKIRQRRLGTKLVDGKYIR